MKPSEKAIEALRPLADAVFNDNGDMTVNIPLVSAEDCIKAYFADKALSAALSQAEPVNADAAHKALKAWEAWEAWEAKLILEGSDELWEELGDFSELQAIRNAALYTSQPAPVDEWQTIDSAQHGTTGIIAAFEQAYPELYWHIAKGKVTAGEPLYGAIITTIGATEIGHGESNISADDALRIAIESAGLTVPTPPPTKGE